MTHCSQRHELHNLSNRRHQPDKPPTFCQLSLVKKMLSSCVAFSLSGENTGTLILPVFDHQNDSVISMCAQWDVHASLLVFLHESLCSFATVEQISAAERRGHLKMFISAAAWPHEHVTVWLLLELPPYCFFYNTQQKYTYFSYV